MNEPAILHCPSCRKPMEKMFFDRKLSGTVELDLCFACQGIWFDKYESLQLEASGVLALFRAINSRRHGPRLPLADTLPCPQCEAPLVQTMNRAKSGAFNYLRCAQGHGHFIIFAEFMIEKGFVRQLSGAEVARLKAQIGMIHCPGCGGAIDIRRDSVCPYCHAPIALLDPQAVEAALAGYQQNVDRKAAGLDAALVLEARLSGQADMNSPRARDFMHGDFGDMLIDGVAADWKRDKS